MAAVPPIAFTVLTPASSMYDAAFSVLCSFTRRSGAPLPSLERPARTPPVSPSGKSSPYAIYAKVDLESGYSGSTEPPSLNAIP